MRYISGDLPHQWVCLPGATPADLDVAAAAAGPRTYIAAVTAAEPAVAAHAARTIIERHPEHLRPAIAACTHPDLLDDLITAAAAAADDPTAEPRTRAWAKGAVPTALDNPATPTEWLHRILGTDTGKPHPALTAAYASEQERLIDAAHRTLRQRGDGPAVHPRRTTPDMPRWQIDLIVGSGVGTNQNAKHGYYLALAQILNGTDPDPVTALDWILITNRDAFSSALQRTALDGLGLWLSADPARAARLTPPLLARLARLRKNVPLSEDALHALADAGAAHAAAANKAILNLI